MVHWSDTFWGEGNRGFEVLSTNVKNGGIAIEEFQRFLNEKYARIYSFAYFSFVYFYYIVFNMNQPIVKIYYVYKLNF